MKSNYKTMPYTISKHYVKFSYLFQVSYKQHNNINCLAIVSTMKSKYTKIISLFSSHLTPPKQNPTGRNHSTKSSCMRPQYQRHQIFEFFFSMLLSTECMSTPHSDIFLFPDLIQVVND
mmetsp:Transcript_26747/g.35763  ORF Transcript_26747/g.35763 Transcript_26747/m.35763 type:complete len:119 (+) Transcript_26747:97-453(+)